VRSRYSSSDFDRMRRGQEVLYAVFRKLMSLNAVSRLPELYNSYKRSVETNLSIEDIVPLLPVASQVVGDSSLIRRYSIGPNHVYPYTTPSGGAVLLPNYNAISQLIIEAIFNP
jgi:polyisoprenyl-teichoic acid--peptidoglycan teichoic acid transferase